MWKKRQFSPQELLENPFTLNGESKLNKENWKGDEKVPTYEAIQAVSCKKCSVKGLCKGTRKIKEKLTVLN